MSQRPFIQISEHSFKCQNTSSSVLCDVVPGLLLLGLCFSFLLSHVPLLLHLSVSVPALATIAVTLAVSIFPCLISVTFPSYHHSLLIPGPFPASRTPPYSLPSHTSCAHSVLLCACVPRIPLRAPIAVPSFACYVCASSRCRCLLVLVCETQAQIRRRTGVTNPLHLHLHLHLALHFARTLSHSFALWLSLALSRLRMGVASPMKWSGATTKGCTCSQPRCFTSKRMSHVAWLACQCMRACALDVGYACPWSSRVRSALFFFPSVLSFFVLIHLHTGRLDC